MLSKSDKYGHFKFITNMVLHGNTTMCKFVAQSLASMTSPDHTIDKLYIRCSYIYTYVSNLSVVLTMQSSMN
jgi:hypothetical protein